MGPVLFVVVSLAFYILHDDSGTKPVSIERRKKIEVS